MIPIRSKNPYNIKKGYVPCGKCDECRLVKKTEWTNRLLIEMDYYQKKHGYKVGFATLTYNEEHLPHIPRKFLKDENELIPCFNYEHVKKLNSTLRKYLWSKHNLENGYRYFITCEYGEKKHRPHMHGIFLFSPKFTHLEFYKFIEDAWTGTTQYIQNNTKRGTERTNYGIINSYEDFVPKDTHAVGAYVAKYVCKDIEYEEFTEPRIKDNLTKKERNELRHYAPFHKQSLGLSRCILENSEKELLEQVKNGVDVIGSAKKKELPNYIKEKLFYRQIKTYNLKTHKYEQIKGYTKTYYENKEKQYNKKYEQNKKMFEKMKERGYWEIKQKETEFDQNFSAYNCAKYAKAIIEYTGIDKLTKFYTIYYGVKYENCKVGKPEEILFQRQNPCADMSNQETINKEEYEKYTNACSLIISLENACRYNKRKRTKIQETKDKIKAFWTNLKQ